MTGISLRVFRADGSPTAAFETFCRIREALASYPIPDEQEYSDREYKATLDNYRGEMWRSRDALPGGWEGEAYDWFILYAARSETSSNTWKLRVMSVANCSA